MQINVRYRFRVYSRNHGFNAPNFKHVVEQYHSASLAMVETLKLEALLRMDTWPVNMQIVKMKILR